MSEEKDKEIEYEQANEEVSETIDLAEKIKKLKELLKLCQKEKQEYLAGWQRCQADFINYKRRQEEQMGEWSKMFGEGLLRDILPVLDTLESGIKNQESRIKKDELELVKKQLIEILRGYGLEEINSIGEKFNPELHEAVEQVEAGEDEGIVAEEVQKGYLLNGKVLRPAKVKVTKKL